jgi:hypothetical protein
VREIWAAEQEFRVQMSAAKRRERHATWRRALDRALL